MAARTLPNLGLKAFYDLGEDGWKDDQDLGLLKLSVLVQPVVLEIVAALPGAPTDGDVVVLDETHATHPNEIAIRDDGDWVYVVPNEGWKVYNVSDASDYRFDGTIWAVASGGGGGLPPGGATGSVLTKASAADDDTIWKALPLESLIVAVGDESTILTVGNNKVTFRMPYAFTLTAVRASLTTASSSGLPTVDINEGGASILSTKLTIDASEKTSTTAATPAVISDAALADDAEITIDIDVAGTGAAGLKVYLIGRQS